MHLPDPDSFSRHETVPADRHLSPLERRVVRMARDDADRGLIEPRGSRLARLLRLLTGVEGAQPLADARLETLRRYACLERRGDRRAGDVAARLIGLGFPAEALAGAALIARG